jgi:hypothetical protein
MFLACGSLGAVLSVILLLMIPTDGGSGYRELIANDLPVLVFAVGIGFGVGMLVALLWSLLHRLFAPHAPGA